MTMDIKNKRKIKLTMRFFTSLAEWINHHNLVAQINSFLIDYVKSAAYLYYKIGH